MNETLLRSIVMNDRLHARWLNTFSYLEYIGFRKIVKSQHASGLTLKLLSHALEEGRHALRLKKLAMKIGGPTFEHYAEETMVCSSEASNYFQELDCACTRADSSLTYLYVTWLVELRAIEIYKNYAEASGSTALASLIGEETNHLAEVQSQLALRDPEFVSSSGRLISVEDRLYRDFCSALEQEVLRG